jgi:hypothetical protein
VVWRNFDVTPGQSSAGAPPGFYKLPLLVGCVRYQPPVRAEAIGRLPPRSGVLLEVPVWLGDALRRQSYEVKCEAKRPAPAGASRSRLCSACSRATMRGPGSSRVNFFADSRYQNSATFSSARRAAMIARFHRAGWVTDPCPFLLPGPSRGESTPALGDRRAPWPAAGAAAD